MAGLIENITNSAQLRLGLGLSLATNCNRFRRVDAANQELKSVLFISTCINSELFKKITSLEEQNKLIRTN